MENPDARLKRFLHYGSEERIYLPNGNLRYSFRPEMVKSIEELLQNDESAPNIVPSILKINELHTSIAPCALLYALAMVVRKAKQNMEGRTSIETSKVKKIKPKRNQEGDPADPPDTEEIEYELHAWDFIIRDAYKAARKLSENNAENFFMFTYYLRHIAISDDKRGFGKGWRLTLDKWYEFQSADALAKSVTRFYSNVTWSHSDLLTLRRWQKCDDDAKNAALTFAKYNFTSASDKYQNDNNPRVKSMMKYLKLINDLRHAQTVEQALPFIAHPDITFDFVPPVFLTSHTTWLHLIPKMPPEQLLSLINRLSRLRMFGYPEIVAKVVSKLGELNTPTIHPMYVYITRKRYEEGPNLAVEFQYIQSRHRSDELGRFPNHQAPGQGNANVRRLPPPRRNEEIVRSLDLVFNKTISSLAPTGVRFFIGFDGTACNASKRCLRERFITIEQAALLTALCVIKPEPVDNVKLVTFTRDMNIRVVPINGPEETMESLKSKIVKDDCMNGNVGHLIRYATSLPANEQIYDVFIVLSDHQVNHGTAHEALKTYKENVNWKAKAILCSFIGRHKKHQEFTKSGMLMICGFDEHVGKLIAAYSRDSFQ